MLNVVDDDFSVDEIAEDRLTLDAVVEKLGKIKEIYFELFAEELK